MVLAKRSYPAQKRPYSINGLVFYAPLWHPGLKGSPFTSKDLTGHTCTVTEATWGVTGRTFDGSNDRIMCGNNSVLNFTSGDFTIAFWMHVPTGADVNMAPMSRGVDNTDGWFVWFDGSSKMQFYTVQSGAQQNSVSGTAATNDTFELWTITRSGTDVAIYLNDTDDTDTAGTHTDPDTSTRQFMIGAKDSASPTQFMQMILGDVWIWNRELAAPEIKSIYHATRGRYGV